MNIKINIYNKLLCVVVGILASSCSLHEFPDDKPINPTLVNVDLQITITADIQIFTKLISATRVSGLATRCIIDVYEADKDFNIGANPVERAIVCGDHLVQGEDYTIQTTLKLNAKRYKFLIWTDITPEGGDNQYYTTSDLKNITIKQPYNGSSEMKDAFCQSCVVDLTPYRNQWNMTLKVPVALERPFAKIEVIATDLELYYDRVRSRGLTRSGDLSVKFAYSGFFPSRYNIHTGKPNNSEPGIWFNSALVPLSNTEALVGFDYVFVNGTESAVVVNMIFYDNSTQINVVEGISIPIKRGKLTTIKGDFLTRDYRPGIHIDSNFDGNITVRIDD